MCTLGALFCLLLFIDGVNHITHHWRADGFTSAIPALLAIGFCAAFLAMRAKGW